MMHTKNAAAMMTAKVRKAKPLPEGGTIAAMPAMPPAIKKPAMKGNPDNKLPPRVKHRNGHRGMK